uniref:SH3 domain-containing protein n=1 Tax=Parascaris univalens TaxID=6257 RepID=A0A915ANN8_PARUN
MQRTTQSRMNKLPAHMGRIYEPAPDYDDFSITEEPAYPPPESLDDSYFHGGNNIKDGGSGGRVSSDRLQNSAAVFRPPSAPTQHIPPRGLRRSPQNTETQQTLMRFGSSQGNVTAYPLSYGSSSQVPPRPVQQPPPTASHGGAKRGPHDNVPRRSPHTTPPQTLASYDAAQQRLYRNTSNSSRDSSHQQLSAATTDSPAYETIPSLEGQQMLPQASMSETMSAQISMQRPPHHTPPSTLVIQTGSRDVAEQPFDGIQKSSPVSQQPTLPAKGALLNSSQTSLPQTMIEHGTTYGSSHSSPSQTLVRGSEYEYRIDMIPKQPERAPRKNMGDYIRAIGGVPVLPPLEVSSELSAGKIGAGDNLAFRRHVANHRQFDTLNSFKSCENCPICKAMNEGQISLAEAAEITKHSHKETSETSAIINGKAFEKLEQDVLAELELLDEYVSRAAEEEIETTEEDPAQTKQTSPEMKLRAQALQDFEGANEAELSVKQGEIIQVLQQKNVWWQCRNSEGTTGWVPVCYIYALPD